MSHPHDKLSDIRVMSPSDWVVTARNLPEHARNAIHTDVGARAAGFPRALVAGVTTYAYLSHPLLVAWGSDWLAHGGAEVRFRRPVFDGDEVRCAVVMAGEGVAVDAITAEPDQPRATLRALRRVGHSLPLRPGEPLATVELTLSGDWGSDYALRASDDISLCSDNGWVHPAVWPAIANNVVHTQVARGSWVHTRSIVRHHAIAAAGATATVRSSVIRRFESHGERAVLDVSIDVEGVTVATLEHEAIVALP